MHIIDFDIPDISTLFDGNILDIIINIFKLIFSLLTALIDCIFSFTTTLLELNQYIVNMVSSIEGGNVEGLPIVQVIGAYRFLVGDMIFKLSYLLIVTGCFFVLYKLCLILYRKYKEAKGDVLSKGNSAKGITSLITQFFK